MDTELPELLIKFRGSNHIERNREIARFCGVNNHTVSMWGRQHEPKGDKLNRLWVFFEAQGLVVSSREKLDPAVKYLSELLAFDVLEPADALQVLKLGKADLQQIWRVLRGDQVPVLVRQHKVNLESLQAEFENRLGEAKRAARLQGLIPANGSTAVPPQPQPAEPQNSELPDRMPESVLLAASLIGGLSPLVAEIMQDKGRIKQLRAAVGDDVFYQTLDGLKAMSSRKAHQFYKGKAGEGNGS